MHGLMHTGITGDWFAAAHIIIKENPPVKPVGSIVLYMEGSGSASALCGGDLIFRADGGGYNNLTGRNGYRASSILGYR